MAAPQRNPAGRYPDGRGWPPGARTQAPPVPPPQGLWPGHPSGPMPQAPPVWPQPPAGRSPAGRSPAGPLPRRQTGPLPAAPGPVSRYVPAGPGNTFPVRTTAQLRRDTLDRTTAQLRPATAVRTARRLPPPATAKGKPLVPGRGTARAVLPGLVLAVIGLGAVAVIALWWQDTPRISGTGSLLTGTGRVLGLLAGYGFVVLVGLMARLPPLERRDRQRPACPLARHRRPVRDHPGHRPRAVHRLGLRGHRAREGDEREHHAAHLLSRTC